MAGVSNGLNLGFRSDANARIYKFTALVQSTANPSTQSQQFAAVPAGPNAPGVLGVTIEHFVEPNYFVPQATNPATVTGSTPTLYNMQGRGLTLQLNGVARCIAAGRRSDDGRIGLYGSDVERVSGCQDRGRSRSRHLQLRYRYRASGRRPELRGNHRGRISQDSSIGNCAHLAAPRVRFTRQVHGGLPL